MRRGDSQRFGRPRWCAVALLLVAVVLAIPEGAWAEDEMRGNQVSFRGGYAGLTDGRGCETFTDVGTVTGVCSNNANSGYYVGGALDLMLTKDFWGLMNKVAATGEIGVEFKRFDSNTTRQAIPSVLGSTATNQTQVTMLTVNVAPKLKFNQFGDLVPWIIPIGLDFHVISPPSNQVNYLDVGIQFGAGIEYRVWKEMKLGLDARFHLAANQTNTVNNFGTIGPYVGIGF